MNVHSFKIVPRQPLEKRAAANAFAGGVLHLEGQQVPLIEGGWPALGAKIEPVLRDGWGARCDAKRPVRRAVLTECRCGRACRCAVRSPGPLR